MTRWLTYNKLRHIKFICLNSYSSSEEKLNQNKRLSLWGRHQDRPQISFFSEDVKVSCCLTWHRKLPWLCGKTCWTSAAHRAADDWSSKHKLNIIKNLLGSIWKNRAEGLNTTQPIRRVVGVLLWNWFWARVGHPLGGRSGIPKMFLATCQHKYKEQAGRERDGGQGPWEAMQVTLPQRNLRGLWWASLWRNAWAATLWHVTVLQQAG